MYNMRILSSEPEIGENSYLLAGKVSKEKFCRVNHTLNENIL